MTCDFCVGWSPSQWEAFAKKRAYKDRKRSSRPSGALPTAEAPSPRAGTSSEVLCPEASSSSLPSGGQAKREGSRDAPCAACREASFPPARPRSSERGGSVSGRSSGARERASASSAPSGAGKGRLPVCSGLPLPAPLPGLPLPAHHSTLFDVVSRESLRGSAPVLDPPVFPDLRIEEQGRIVEPALGRTALVTGPVVLAIALLTAHGQAVETVGGGTRLDRCPPTSGHGVTGRGLWTAPGRVAFALALGETAFDVPGRGLLTATGRADSIRVPLLAGEVAVTICGHTIPLAALVTARGHVRSLPPPLTTRGHGREDGEPDLSSRSVWRRLLSPRLLLSLGRLRQ